MLYQSNMSYGIVVMKILVISLIGPGFLGMNAEVYYAPRITDDIFSCDKFDNKYLDCDSLKLSSAKGPDGDESPKLNGQMKSSLVLTAEYDIEIDVWKSLDLADEYMYTTRVNFCTSLQDENNPWYPLIQQLNITSCPVPENVFEVKGMTISLDSLKDVMCHNFVGAYRIQISFMDGAEKLTCHVIELSIVEVNDEDEDE